MSLKSPALAGEFLTTKATWEAYIYIYTHTHTYIYKAYFKVIFGNNEENSDTLANINKMVKCEVNL